MEGPKSPAAQVQVEKRPKGQAGSPDAQRAGGRVRAHGGTEAGWALSRKPQGTRRKTSKNSQEEETVTTTADR